MAVFQSPPRGFNECNQIRAQCVPWRDPPFSPLLGASMSATELHFAVQRQDGTSFSPLLGASMSATGPAQGLAPGPAHFQSPPRGFNECNPPPTPPHRGGHVLSVPSSGLQ